MTRVLPIAALAAGAAVSVVAFDGAGSTGVILAASNAAACGTPQISTKLTYHEEEVKYDLGITIVSSPGSPTARRLGLYGHENKISFTTRSEGECLRRLDVLVEVFPVIRLMSDYKKRMYRCAKQYVLDHEREHGSIARKSYQGFAHKIKKRAATMFSRPSGGGHEAILRRFVDELDGGPMTTKFLGDLEKKQEAFHAKERTRAIISVKCRLTKTKPRR